MNVSAEVPAVIGGGLVTVLLLIALLLLLIVIIIIKSKSKAFGMPASQIIATGMIIITAFWHCTAQAAQNAQEDIDLHDYEEVDNETDIETKECAAYVIQTREVDLESNPAYIYAQIGDQAANVEAKECVAYGVRDTVTTKANPAYQTVTAR